MLDDLQLSVEQLQVSYDTRLVLAGVSFELRRGEALVVAGRNGAGKSTLLRSLCGVQRIQSGQISYRIGGKLYSPEETRPAIGLVAPDLVLYRELSAAENLHFFASVRGLRRSQREIEGLLEQVGLQGRGNDRVAAYSSGMQQRLRYAYALLHEPPILLLDEPTVTLDQIGSDLVNRLIADQRERGLLVIATNDTRELALGDYILHLD